MISFLLVSLAFALSVYFFLKWATKNHDYFQKQGIKNEKPLPLVGNSHYLFTGNVIKGVHKQYCNFPNEKVVGSFEFLKPVFFLRSPEVIKQLAVKDFFYFQDHVPFVNEQSNSDDLFANILFLMKGKQWRDMRSSLSPLFTGRKMRIMLQLIIKCCKQMCEHLKEEYEENGPTSNKMKILFSKYTNDVIATCAFGVEVNSFKNPNNDIYDICRKALGIGKSFFIQIMKILSLRFFPRIARILGIKLFPDEAKIKFTELVTHAMDLRKKQNIERPDMLQLLMKLKEGQLSIEKEIEEIDPENKMINGEIKKHWTDVELTAQCFIFFLGGFHTTSSVLSFCSYALAVNPDLQEKLITEIDEAYESLGGDILTYEILMKIKYLDVFISEVLRMWPPLIVSNRECKQTYNYKGNDGLKFTIQKADAIVIPIYSLHMDPKHFSNPEKFDPDRFSDENRHNNNMDAYLPFGVGPRNCIAFRFALMIMKAVIFQLLLNFRITVCNSTQIPIETTFSTFGLAPKNDVEVQFIPRGVKIRT